MSIHPVNQWPNRHFLPYINTSETPGTRLCCLQMSVHHGYIACEHTLHAEDCCDITALCHNGCKPLGSLQYGQASAVIWMIAPMHQVPHTLPLLTKAGCLQCIGMVLRIIHLDCPHGTSWILIQCIVYRKSVIRAATASYAWGFSSFSCAAKYSLLETSAAPP